MSWASHESALRQIREQVFIKEQKVPPEIEWDNEDAGAIHLLAYNRMGEVVACARLLDIGKVGRMGVLHAWRGLGIGQALLNEAINLFREKNHRKINLSAQTHAIKFYEKAGFKVVSDAYIDVNIWHVDMQLDV